ncbi:hypothetical protein NPIL_255301 [Nephila pilipes]|uniref:Uncharacterized protein n=1 Tax=Nephila pilipes TaxID=299642 RepID=A0A8X6P7R8_NEPPI|nr:hypothetical protein NPIL_255301 [Nephila pilipes]
MEKSEASAQRYNDYPDFGKDNRGASARSDMHCLKFFTVPSVHGTFLPSFSLVLLEGHVEEVESFQGPSAVIRYPKYSTWSVPIID